MLLQVRPKPSCDGGAVTLGARFRVKHVSSLHGRGKQCCVLPNEFGKLYWWVATDPQNNISNVSEISALAVPSSKT